MHFDQGVMSRHLALQIQQYQVPDFQRSYSWTEPEWKTLWVDVLRQYKEVSRGWQAGADVEANTTHLVHVPTHYLGTLVTAHPVTVSPPKSTVVDGQQRLLTSWVLLLASRDYWLRRIGRAAGRREEAAAVRARYAPYLTNIGHSGRDLWRIVPQEIDQPAFEHLMLDTRAPGPVSIDSVGLRESDSAALLRAYNFFLREMSRRALPANAPFEMLSFAGLYRLDPALLEYTIMNRLYAIKLVADATDDPNMIFESLNTKGRDLQQVDLIKNFLYLSLGADASAVYRSYWRPMEGVLRPNELERFAWASLVSRGENVLQKRTYEAVQRRLRASSVQDVRDYVVDLHSESVWFERLIRPSRETNAVVRRAVEDVLAAGGSTALPLLLYAYRRLQSGEASAAQFRDALRSIESFLVRRMLAGDSTNNLNSMFGIMCSRLHSDPRFLAGDDLVTDVRRVLASRPDDWPTTDRVRIGVAGGDFYHSQSTKQRMHVLIRLDSHFNASAVSLNYELSDGSIEHIAPQDDGAAGWVSALSADEWEAMRKRRDALCNLTLLLPADNSSLGSKAWAQKRATYDGYDYPLTARLAEKFDESGGWTLQRMDDRTSDLVAAIDEVWPRIEVSERPVAPTVEAAAEEEVGDEEGDAIPEEFGDSLLDDGSMSDLESE